MLFTISNGEGGQASLRDLLPNLSSEAAVANSVSDLHRLGSRGRQECAQELFELSSFIRMLAFRARVAVRKICLSCYFSMKSDVSRGAEIAIGLRSPELVCLQCFGMDTSSSVYPQLVSIKRASWQENPIVTQCRHLSHSSTD